MSKYAKLIVAGIGTALMALSQFGGIDLTAQADAIYTMVVAVATAIGVWAVPNSA